MLRYAVKRILSAIPLLLVISLLIFMFIHLIPGDPARIIAGKEATSYEIENVREQLGLNEPLLKQYLIYMKGLFTLDLGDSIRNGATVFDTIKPRFLPTVQLTILAMLWATLLGTFLGIMAAVRRGRALKRK